MAVQILSEGYRFRRGTGSPFDAQGDKWCPRCHDFVRTGLSRPNRQDVFAFKEWCRSCGMVITMGVYYHVPCITAIPDSLFSVAQQWVAAQENKG